MQAIRRWHEVVGLPPSVNARWCPAALAERGEWHEGILADEIVKSKKGGSRAALPIRMDHLR
ncbi:hypothetical protein SS05631_c04970 [Sinorhizobium sp. CCBAU 05631]|nr:hypothetical protein SS05631_c04970 [Sinorhizobium sp. CCBAU 05631]